MNAWPVGRTLRRGRRRLLGLTRLGKPRAIGLSLVLLWGLALAALASTWQGLETASLQRAELFTRLLAEQADKSMRTVELIARAAADRVPLQPDAVGQSRLLGELAEGQPALRSLHLVDAGGRVLASNGRVPRSKEIAGGSLPEVAAGWMRLWTDPTSTLDWELASGRDLADARPLEPGTAPARLVALRAWPVTAGDRARAGQWVVAVLNLEHFATQQAVLMDDERWQAALIDVQGRLLAATPNLKRVPGESVAPHPAIDGLVARSQRAQDRLSRSGTGLDGQASLTAHQVLARHPLVVVAETARAHLVRVWLESAAGVLAAALLGSGLLLAYARALARQDATRLQALRQARLAAHRVSRSEHELRSLVDGLPEWAFRIDSSGRIQFVNRCWTRLSGLPDDRVLGRLLEDVLHPDDVPALRSLFQRACGPVAGDPRVARVRLLSLGGEWRELDLTLAALSEDGEGGHAGFALDVTERERARRQLVEQYRTTEQLLDAMPQPLFLTDASGELQMANRAWVEWLGLAASAPDGGDAPGLDDLSQVHAVIGMGTDEVARGGARSWPVDLPGPQGGVRETLLSKVPLRREDGAVVGVIGTLVDVTEFRQAERFTERARRAAEAASAARAEFVANVSHELRTPLQSILGFAELGRDRQSDPQRAALLFQRIHGSGARMLKLVEDLLDVSTLSSPVGRVDRRPAPPAAVLQDIGQELRALADGGRIALQIRSAHELQHRPALIDPARYAQVLRNVLANAIRFAPPDTAVEVTLADVDGHAIVAVRDHGPGIPESELEAIFEPFVQSTRTRDGSGGTGLGLAICRSIMRTHGGFVIADNHPRGGAVFRIGLPWCDTAVPPAAVAAVNAVAAPGPAPQAEAAATVPN